MTHISILHAVANMCHCGLNVKTACRNCADQRRTAMKQIMTGLSLMRGTRRHV